MYELMALGIKYILAVVIYLFIFRIVRLISQDMRAVAAGENALLLLPHLKLLTPLTGREGQRVAETYPLMRPVTVIGRASNCDISLPDPYISSEHLRIEKQKDRLFLVDLGSANGSYVNNEKLGDRRELKDGDRISVGGVDLLYSEGSR